MAKNWFKSRLKALEFIRRKIFRGSPFTYLLFFKYKRPHGYYESVDAYLKEHPEVGRVICSGEKFSYPRKAPEIIDGRGSKILQSEQCVEGVDFSVFHFNNVRFHGYYGGNVITAENKLIGDLSPDVWGFRNNKLLSSLGLQKPLKLSGLSAIFTGIMVACP